MFFPFKTVTKIVWKLTHLLRKKLFKQYLKAFNKICLLIDFT